MFKTKLITSTIIFITFLIITSVIKNKTRILEKEITHLNLNILSIKGEFLVISQFTLYASYTKGTRPNFSDAASSDDAKYLYDDFVSELKKHRLIVATGRFGAKMEVHMVGDGPVTFLLESP